MKYICYVCECGCHFAIESLTNPSDPGCPNCGSEWTVDATGECMIDPKIVFDEEE